MYFNGDDGIILTVQNMNDYKIVRALFPVIYTAFDIMTIQVK